MSDKLRSGIAVRTTFVDGESPRAAKLNSLSAQLQNATLRLEASIGDIHSESYPYSTLTAEQLSRGYGHETGSPSPLSGAPSRALDIANLGRLIGPASNLNPHILGTTNITEDVPVGVHEFTLKYLPEVPSSVIFDEVTVFATYIANPYDLDDVGEYSIDAYGRVYTVSATLGGTAFYGVDPTTHSGMSTYQGASFNVIPDVNQLELGSGCSIGAQDTEGRWPVMLPLCTHHHYNTAEDSVTLSATDPTFGAQLQLPKILVDNWSLEEVIPGGFLFLKNYTKNKVYKAATYYFNSSTSILIGGEDIQDDVDAGDTFCIITVGTDITTSIDDLRRKAYHTHDRRYGEPLVPVSALAGILSVAGNSGAFVPSDIPGNWFPQYLHRDGYGNGADFNLNDSNIMRGSLAIGLKDGLAGEHISSSGESYKILFPQNTSGGYTQPEIYRSSDDSMVYNADQLDLKPTNQGHHFTNGGLVPEDGIYSGLSGIELGIIPVGFQLLNQTNAGNVNITIDFQTDFGIDSATYHIISITCMARISGAGNHWVQTNTAGTTYTTYDDADVVLTINDYDSASPNTVVFHFAGSDYNAAGDVDLKGVLWVTKDVV